jgi:MFS superfamily sulfate permease-like transporter
MVAASIEKYNGILYPSEALHSRNTMNDSLATSNNTISGRGFFKSSQEELEQQLLGVKFISENRDEAKVLIAMTLSLLSGFFLILFSILHIGALTKYLSDAIVNGFTTGAAYHVICSQISVLLGITLEKNKSYFVLISVNQFKNNINFFIFL